MNLESFGWSGCAGLRQSFRKVAVPERSCPFHDVNSIDVKLSSQAGFGFVLPKTKHTNARNQYYRRIGVAHAGGVRLRKRLVVFRVFLAIPLQRGIDLLFQILQAAASLPGHKEWADFGSYEMIRAAGA